MWLRIHSIAIWMWHRPVWMFAIACLVAFLSINLVAYRHARAMLWFAGPGERTARPQDLSTIGKIGVLLTGVRIPRPENDRTPADIGLIYQTERIPVDDTVTLEAWSIPAGSARGTAILFHGYSASKSDMLSEAEAFHNLEFDVWLIDFRGSGGSSERYTTVGYLEAEDVVSAVKYVQARSGSNPLVLYGQSMGAAAILRGLSISDMAPDAIVLESVFDRMSTTAGNRFRQMGLPAFPGANLLLFWGGVCGGFNASQHNPVDYAADCQCPTVMLHGELDPNARLEEGDRVLKNLRSRDAEMVVFPKVGHSPTLAADRERWLEAMQRLIEKISGSGRHPSR
ncbi:MAG: alpha/beta fold hydrolase [Planctomycetes bacterium]|nr:alpha/beta fold hydrolase [Planctomycetota bacterium]